jgi:hypothetical protein
MLTTREVDRSMKDMDSIYSTVFYVWIKNPNNVLYTADHLYRIIPNDPNEHILVGLKWLTASWSLESRLTLLLNVFYLRGGVTCSAFIYYMKGLTDRMIRADQHRAIFGVLFHEPLDIKRTFIEAFTSEWSVNEIKSLRASLENQKVNVAARKRRENENKAF